MGYTFISYSSKNQTTADSMRALLKKNGIEIWMAPYDIPAGRKYAQVINRALKNCSCLLLILSNNAQSSTWVGKEVERAVNYRKPIIPVQIEDVVLNDEFELYISTDQIVSINKTDRESKELNKLIDGVISFTTDSQTNIRPDSKIRETQEQKIGINSVVDGKYKIISHIGSGVYCEVFLAENITTKKKWAIKVIDIEQSNYADFNRRLPNETAVLNKLNYPGLPYIADIIHTENQLIIIMDYLDGVSLYKYIKDNGVPDIEVVIDWAEQLCDILVYLQKQEPAIIHNDIHPQNIILDSNGMLSLIDFGAATEYKANQDEYRNAIGTTLLCAPEKYRGASDKRTDIYSLGLTLYILATGKNPTSPPFTLEPLEKNHRFAYGLEYIINKCVRMNPNERYQSADELLEDLNNIERISDKMKKPRPFKSFFKKKS